MSYAFNVIKRPDGALELRHHESAGQHLPDGARFQINGHHPFPGTSSMGTIGVSLTTVVEPTEEQPYPFPTIICSATAAYNAEVNK